MIFDLDIRPGGSSSWFSLGPVRRSRL